MYGPIGQGQHKQELHVWYLYARVAILECPDHCCRYIIMHTYISHTHDVTLGAKVLRAGMIYGISTCFQVWYHIIPSNILQRVYSVLHLCFIVNYNLANTKGDSVFIYIRQVSNRCTNCPNSVAHLVLTGMYPCFAFSILGEGIYWKLSATLTFFWLKLNLLLLPSSSKMLSLVLYSVISL